MSVYPVSISGKDAYGGPVIHHLGPMAPADLSFLPWGRSYIGQVNSWAGVDLVMVLPPTVPPGVDLGEDEGIILEIHLVEKGTGRVEFILSAYQFPRSPGGTVWFRDSFEDQVDAGFDPMLDFNVEVYINRIRRKQIMLCTACYAAGDGRYYSRHEFDAAATDAQIIAHFTACALASEAKLMSIMKSILYDNTGIPDSEPDVEYIFRPLVEFAAITGETTKIRQFVELRVVGNQGYDVAAWFDTNKASLRSKGGTVAETLITNGSNQKQERKPRTS